MVKLELSFFEARCVAVALIERRDRMMSRHGLPKGMTFGEASKVVEAGDRIVEQITEVDPGSNPATTGVEIGKREPAKGVSS